MAGNKNMGIVLMRPVALGVISSIVVSLIGVMVLSKLQLEDKVGERGIRAGLLVLIAVSSLLGSQIAARYGDKKTILTAMVAGFAVMVFVLAGGMLLDGPFQNVGPTMIAFGAGVGISCVLCMKQQGKGSRRNKRIR